MKQHPQAPILEFDPDPHAVIDPTEIHKPIDGAAGCVLAFLPEAVERITAEHNGRQVGQIKTEMGSIPIWMISWNGCEMGLVSCGVGAPLAAGMMEELAGRGFRTFVACGSCGVLDPDVHFGKLVLVTAALRDEGTSYHYLPAARWVEPDAHVTDVVADALDAAGLPFVRGKTWTTDAFFRETRGKVAARREEGCLTVEMEAAALFAVARFRGLRVGAVLYGGDDVSGQEWDPRLWTDKKQAVRSHLVSAACDGMVRLLSE